MKNCVNLLYLCILLFHNFHIIWAHTIYVYSDHNKEGTKVEISISNCSNLPEGMAGQLTSINTRDRCARFFDGWNCSANSIEVLPHSPSHGNLHSWDFNDKALSVGPCRESCSIEVTGVQPEDTLEIEIFSRKDFRGAYQSIYVDGCTPIPTFFIHRLLSVKTNGHCLQLYNNIDCTEKGNNVKSIELRPGTPFHHDISHWWFPEARALSHCSHKCNTSSSSQISRVPISPGRGEVILFDEKEFKGNSLKINVEDGPCINMTREWEGTAVSVKVDGTQTCVILYDRRGCKGGSQVVTTSQDLSERKFDALTRSLKLWTCGNQEGVNKPGSQMTTASGATLLNGSHTPSYTKPQKPKTEGHTSVSPVIIATGIAVPICGVVLSVLLVFFIMRRCHPYKNIMEMLSEKEIQEFLSGLGMDIESNRGTTGNDDYSTELLAQNRPYNEAYEISRSQIKFDTKVPLGMGEFGVVYKGTLVLNKESDSMSGSELKTFPVAIKTVKPNTNAQYLRSLLKEVKVMLYIGKHPNVIHMVGCCTENLRKGEILVLIDYCAKGSLESYLQKNRAYFKNIVEKGKIRGTEVKEHQSSSMQNYKNLDVFTSLPFFDFFQLLNWCIEVARGMEFLALSKVVHADLAARNVLLDQDFHAKISDFGLSRQLYCYSEYVKKRREPLPWRWLAIESLKSLEFSSKSDVWSYGVLCWEIFTLGEKPYPGVVWSDAFLLNLEEGLRLPKPKFVTTELYNLMIRCWEENPGDRPSFTEILEEIQESSAFHDYSNQSHPVVSIT